MRVHCFAKTYSLESSMSNVNANPTQMACLSLKGPIVIIHIILDFQTILPALALES
jgi:hypothetical protein